jgi:hypothetical protein
MSTRPLTIADAEIRTIYDLLEMMRVRPGMWIGQPSITRLSIFIQGFVSGVRAAHESLEGEAPLFHGFHDWIAARLGRPKNGHGWSDMLLDSTGGNEELAFEKFWQELDAFRAD